MYILQNKLEKDQKKLEWEKQKEEIQYNQALNFYEKKLLKKYFMNGILKYHIKLTQEKNLMKGQSHLKTAVSSFMNRLKSQINNNEQTTSVPNEYNIGNPSMDVEILETTKRKQLSNQLENIAESEEMLQE